MSRSYYSAPIKEFLTSSPSEVLGHLAAQADFSIEQTQRDAWLEEISILQSTLRPFEGFIYFEYSIPRMGRRADAVVLIDSAILVLEFKVGEKAFTSYALDQVCDYALDLKNFHEPSHNRLIAPILVATDAEGPRIELIPSANDDRLLLPIRSNAKTVATAIRAALDVAGGGMIDPTEWLNGRYSPTPTIIEAALALYNNHSVCDISRSDAGAMNLGRTSDSISTIIESSRQNSRKAICFVTGVPGAGKTLVGLNMATKHIDKATDLHSVYLSGNGPLVAILREALARDRIEREKARGKKTRKGEALSEVKMFIQNVHHFRDDCLQDPSQPPIEHVAIFDEAQRAWNVEQTSRFMRQKRRTPNFDKSEPEFLISCLDRHVDWAVVVCLVGGGQEINTGEAGISEWIESLMRSFPNWHIHVSPHLTDSEYGAGEILKPLRSRSNVFYNEDLHLGVSMRSFRAENVSLLVKQILDMDVQEARRTFKEVKDRYPLVLTRDLHKAKQWLRVQALGTERYGIVVSSAAERLKPLAIDVKSPVDPVHWFLDGKEDVRSSYYLEDVATEFDVQGLELDWTCVTWDADFRYSDSGWDHWSFCGDGWRHVKKAERQMYLKNAYRVLLTRARQGMIIVVPSGDEQDPTRRPEFYNPTFDYLFNLGFPVI